MSGPQKQAFYVFIHDLHFTNGFQSVTAFMNATKSKLIYDMYMV